MRISIVSQNPEPPMKKPPKPSPNRGAFPPSANLRI